MFCTGYFAYRLDRCFKIFGLDLYDHGSCEFVREPCYTSASLHDVMVDEGHSQFDRHRRLSAFLYLFCILFSACSVSGTPPLLFYLF